MELEASSAGKRRGGRVEPTLWTVLAIVSLASLSGYVVLFGLMLLVPGILLLLAPNLLIYLGALRLSVWLWRGEKAPVAGVVVLVVTALMVLGSPRQVNQGLEAEASELKADDFDMPRDTPRPRSIQVIREYNHDDCVDACLGLLSRGVVERIVFKNSRGDEASANARYVVYAWSKNDDCRTRSSKDAEAGTCLVKSLEAEPKIDLSFEIRSVPDLERDWAGADRLVPWSLGPMSVEVLEAWPCANAEGCEPIAHQTFVQQQRLFAPLVLYVDPDSGMYMRRAWARREHGDKADLVAFIAGNWPTRR